jgi:hypothetical protein
MPQLVGSDRLVTQVTDANLGAGELLAWIYRLGVDCSEESHAYSRP